VGDTTWPEFPVNNGEGLLLHYRIPTEIPSPLVLLNIFVHFAWREGVRNFIISQTCKKYFAFILRPTDKIYEILLSSCL
jgi:hypothetical protein